MVSAIHQQESAIGIHTSFPSKTSLPPPSVPQPSRLSQTTDFGFPVSYSKFLLATHFIYGNVYTSMLLFQIIPPSLSPTMSKSVLYVCISIAAL